MKGSFKDLTDAYAGRTIFHGALCCWRGLKIRFCTLKCKIASFKSSWGGKVKSLYGLPAGKTLPKT